MTPRRILFWAHLITGSVAGIVILIMSVTGVLLAYERQILNWSNRGFRAVPGVPGQPQLPIESLLATLRLASTGEPTAITVRSDPAAPVQFSYGRERTLLVNGYSGAILGEQSPKWRSFFSTIVEVHRYLGAKGETRTSGRAVTGACNLAFLLLVVSGPFIWWPKDWSWRNLRKVVFFRGELSGRARDWNWHNVIGIWCFLPLFLIVLTGVVMSYPWANNLLFRMTGNEPPPPAQAQRPQRGPAQGSNRDVPNGARQALNAGFAQARRQVPEWQSITLRLPNAAPDPLVFSIDAANGGRPDQRSQLTVNATDATVLRWETFSSYNLGRRLRAWGRFTHTGEAGGIFGQSIAATASAGAAVLVWTGLALALRRLNGWRKRFRPQALERG